MGSGFGDAVVAMIACGLWGWSGGCDGGVGGVQILKQKGGWYIKKSVLLATIFLLWYNETLNKESNSGRTERKGVKNRTSGNEAVGE